MLLDVFSGILAALMLVIAALLAILITMNSVRGENAANMQLMLVAGCFVIGGMGFYALKCWAKRSAGTIES
jgi:hypothetical protein